ncbi:hypothetical protein WH50_06455 [Pokkaliibacter plantistimulans]|uniref:Uncharacterized protein n=1 Tax=Pokkaliibacter plantistimulans TaxID=1635171 RepID=A0ABX5LZL8_9GAMM|nr:hypothetical protein [Pokkaliibacter plantistimulans]PXF32092.1 hypothetical protein WH50_06455 [Pokkaliibacter plantistimulans]
MQYASEPKFVAYSNLYDFKIISEVAESSFFEASIFLALMNETTPIGEKWIKVQDSYSETISACFQVESEKTVLFILVANGITARLYRYSAENISLRNVKSILDSHARTDFYFAKSK